MKPVESIARLLHGNICRQYLDKGEDSGTASLLATSQIVALGVFLVISINLIFFDHIQPLDYLPDLPRYQLLILLALPIIYLSYRLNRKFDWVGYGSNTYSKMTSSSEYKIEKRVAKLIPYMVMGMVLLVVATSIYRGWV